MDPIPTSTNKAPWWTWPAGAIAIILSCVVSIFAPAYKSVTKERDTLQIQVTTYQSKFQASEAQRLALKDQVQKSYTSGTLSIPVFGPDGKPAYRVATWKAFNMASVKTSVSDALSSVTQTVTESVTVTVHDVVKEKTVTKRMAVDVGLGYSTEATWWPLWGARIIGPVGAWATCEVDPTKGLKLVRQGVGGAKMSF